ncbi:MAG: glycosyltransferase family 4 protein [Prevotella sp.]|nr:glycosyltransferase family 4 protein [Prevotella sp.]
MKRIAYLSTAHFADCDLPLLHELMRKEQELIYILQLTEKDKSRTLINVQQLKKRGNVFPATDYPELLGLSRYIDLNRMFVLNMPGRHDWSLANLMAVFRLVRFLQHKSIDIIHLTWPPRYGVFWLYRLHRRMILTMHDPLPHSSQTGHLNLLHRWMAIKLIPRFILLNEVQRNEFISRYRLQPSQVLSSHLSIYTHLIDTPTVLPKAKDYVLFIGSINTHKGVDVLCQAMQQVHNTYPQLKLVVAGSGRIYFDIQPYINAGFLELHNRYLNDSELKGFIEQSLFVVCPYIDATQSGVVMSAFALAKPVIVTCVGGLPEMVEEGRHGLLVPPKDPEALAKAIIILTDKRKAEAMQHYIRADFHSGERSWESIAEGIIAIYHEQTS